MRISDWSSDVCSSDLNMVQGQCLCGAVRFRGEPDRERGVTACHCGQCRRWGGGEPLIAVRFKGGLEFEADATLAWFPSSDHGAIGRAAWREGVWQYV